MTILYILKCWYAKCSVAVKWGNGYSVPVYLQTGVHQGGILPPPIMFAIYVNSLTEQWQVWQLL